MHWIITVIYIKNFIQYERCFIPKIYYLLYKQSLNSFSRVYASLDSNKSYGSGYIYQPPYGPLILEILKSP